MLDTHRDGKFTAQFKRILEDAGVHVVLTSYQSPSMNSVAERWILSVKSACLNKMILFGEESLRDGHNHPLIAAMLVPCSPVLREP